RAQLKTIRHDLAELQRELFAAPSKTVAAVVRQKEAQEEEVAEHLQEELAKAAQPAARAWQELPKVRQMIRDGGDEVRVGVRSVLGRMIEDIWLLIVRRGGTQLCAAQVFFVGGAHRDYLIVNCLAGNRRPGSWSARSFATVAGKADIDLRKQADAKKVEK